MEEKGVFVCCVCGGGGGGGGGGVKGVEDGSEERNLKER